MERLKIALFLALLLNGIPFLLWGALKLLGLLD